MCVCGEGGCISVYCLCCLNCIYPVFLGLHFICLALCIPHSFKGHSHPCWWGNWTECMMESSYYDATVVGLQFNLQPILICLYEPCIHFCFSFRGNAHLRFFCACLCVQSICLFTPGKTLHVFHISLGLCVLNNGTDHYSQHNTLEVSLCLWIVLLKDSTDACVGANAF